LTNKISITERYRVVPRTLIFIFNESEVLLIKQNSDNKPGFNKWNGIGGHIEEGEDPYFAAKREIKEESGLSIINITLQFITIIPDSHDFGVCLFIFSGKSKVKTIKESPEGKLRWINIDHLKEFPLMDDLPRLLELVISQSSYNCPQILSYTFDTKKIKIDVVK
jgi:8-oxo-dGTP diphosphatase